MHEHPQTRPPGVRPGPAVRTREASASTTGLRLVSLAVFIDFVRPQDYFHFLESLHLPMLISIAACLFWLWQGEKSSLRNPVIRLQILFTLLAGVSVLYASSKILAFNSAFALLMYLAGVTLPFVAFVRDSESLVRFFRIFVAIHVMVVVTSFPTGRGSGSFLGEENDLALAFNVVIPYAYFLAQSPRAGRLGRLLMIGAMVALVAGVVNTNSRGGFVGLLAAAGAIVLVSRNRVRNLMLLAMLGGAIAMAIPSAYWTEMRTIEDVQNSTRLDRLYLWTMGWHMYQDYPVLGVGAGNYGHRVYEYELRAAHNDELAFRSHYGYVAHSLYVTVISELGTVGTIIYGALVFLVMRKLIVIARLPTRIRDLPPDLADLILLARAMCAGLVGFLTSGAFLSVLYYPHLWYAVGFTIALDKAVTIRRREYAGDGKPTPAAGRPAPPMRVS